MKPVSVPVPSQKFRVLLTTTSFQDTPGAHQVLLDKAAFDLVRERGPLTEERMLSLAGNFDAFICGDDDITRAVLEKSLPRLRVISKYGVGLDKIDLAAAEELGVPVFSTPGVNHTTVAEHTFALMLAATRNIVPEANYVAQGNWKRLTGHELLGKTVAIVGLGRIGQEVAIRARAFGMKLLGFGNYWEDRFATELGIDRRTDLEQLLREADILTLHTKLTANTRHLINASNISCLKPGAILINCARGEVVETTALVDALKTGRIGAYAADVLDIEPPPADHPLLGLPNVVITPHIGSRTVESVQRQGTCAVENLTRFLAAGSAVSA
ncbi:MAG TPA: phosphoglycerate dehydrogenase [Chthoniobacterales bacterium]